MAISTGHEHEHGQGLSLPSLASHIPTTQSPHSQIPLPDFQYAHSGHPHIPLLSHFIFPQSSLPHTHESATPPRNPFAFLTRANIGTVPSLCRVGHRDKVAVLRDGFDSMQKYGASRGSVNVNFRPSLVSTAGSGTGARKQFAAPRSQGTPFHSLS
jgi:hypothetical protein